MPNPRLIGIGILLAAVVCAPALAQGGKRGGQVGEMSMTESDVVLFKESGYSPWAGRRFPTKVLWGDTHLHTSLSLDARAFGVTLGPEEAYRLARGEEVTTSRGERIRLSRPLDWLVVADHSDAMGAMNEIVAGNPALMRDPILRDWHERINAGGETALAATMEVIEVFGGITGRTIPDLLTDRDFAQAESK